MLSTEPVARKVTQPPPPQTTSDLGDYSVDMLAPEPAEPLLYRVLSGATARVMPPKIVSQPSSVTVALGETVTLSVRAESGYAALRYLWQKNGVTIPGADSATYTFTASSVSAAGSYKCVVANSSYPVTSNAATVVVTAPLIPPSIAQQPVGQVVVAGTGLTLSVGAGGTGPFSYQWRKDGVKLAGATAATYKVAQASVSSAGSYDCVVSNSGGSATSAVASVAVKLPPNIISQPSSMTVNVGAAVGLSVNASGSGTLSYQWRRGGKSIPGATTSNYAFTALNAAVAGAYDCVVTDSVSSVTSAPANVVLRGGTFHGLIERQALLNSNLASRIEVTATATGACSLKVTTGSLSFAATGQLAAGKTSQAVLEVTVPKLGALSLGFDDSANSFTGTLKNAGATSAAGVDAWRNPWAETAGNAAKIKGPYSFYFQQSDTNPALPQGYGYGSFEVNTTTGNLTMVGALADGSPLTGSTFVGKDGQVLLYAPLNSNRGSIAGTLLVLKGLNAPKDNTIEGAATWFKPATGAGVKDTGYLAGFGPMTLNASGGVYVPPAAGGRLLGVPAAANNATLVFNAGGLNSEVNQPLTVVNPSPSGLVNTASIPANPNGVKLPTLSTAKGLFSGEFTLAGSTRTAQFSGQVVTVAGQTKGYGFFLLPKVPEAGETAATAPKLSGKVIFKATGQ